MTRFKLMDKKIRTRKRGTRFQHGGAREGSGPKPSGYAKVKVCVSLDANIFQVSLNKWRNPFSNLVEMLLDQYAAGALN
jgi:hypothetical protein